MRYVRSSQPHWHDDVFVIVFALIYWSNLDLTMLVLQFQADSLFGADVQKINQVLRKVIGKPGSQNAADSGIEEIADRIASKVADRLRQATHRKAA